MDEYSLRISSTGEQRHSLLRLHIVKPIVNSVSQILLFCLRE